MKKKKNKNALEKALQIVETLNNPNICWEFAIKELKKQILKTKIVDERLDYLYSNYLFLERYGHRLNY